METNLRQIYAFNRTYILTKINGYFFDDDYNVFSNKAKGGTLHDISASIHNDTIGCRPSITLYSKTYMLEDLVLGTIIAENRVSKLIKTEDKIDKYEIITIHMHISSCSVLGLPSHIDDEYEIYDSTIQKLIAGYSIIYLDGDIKNYKYSNMSIAPMYKYYTWCKTNGYKPYIIHSHKVIIVCECMKLGMSKFMHCVEYGKSDGNHVFSSEIYKEIGNALNLAPKTIKGAYMSRKKFMPFKLDSLGPGCEKVIDKYQ